jgi:hypothetical protein
MKYGVCNWIFGIASILGLVIARVWARCPPGAPR